MYFGTSSLEPFFANRSSQKNTEAPKPPETLKPQTMNPYLVLVGKGSKRRGEAADCRTLTKDLGWLQCPGFA